MTSDRTVIDRRGPSAPRDHALDALRAGALLLGIVLHSLLPFVASVPWLVSDDRRSAELGIPVFVIHLFRMSLFMLLAGYFGRLVLGRRGPGSYLKDRLVRVLLVFVVFWPVAVLTTGLMAVINADVNDRPLPVPPQPADPALHPLLAVNPGQLWFLLVLMQCVVIVLVVRAVGVAVLGQERSERWLRRVAGALTAPVGVLLAAVPYATGLVLQGSVTGGIIAPVSLLPEWPSSTAYLGAFVVGWVLHTRRDALHRLTWQWPAHLVIALVASAVALPLSDPASTSPLPVAALVTALAGWCWVYGLIGVCLRFLHAERPVVRYLADGSYWAYLMHLPLLLGVEILLVRQPWPIMLKLVLTWAVVGLLLLVSYHLLVRSTPLGRWLNGRRHPFRIGRAAPAPRQEDPAGSSDRARQDAQRARRGAPD